MRILHPIFCQVVPGGVVITETSEANVGLIKPSDEIQAQERTTGPCHGFVSKIQRGVNLFELFAKHKPGVAGSGRLQPATAGHARLVLSKQLKQIYTSLYTLDLGSHIIN